MYIIALSHMKALEMCIYWNIRKFFDHVALKIGAFELWLSFPRENILCFVSELGGDEYGGADGASGVAGDEGFHR